MKHYGIRILQGFMVLVISLLVTEGLLWVLGFRPYQYQAYSLSSEPDFCLMPHPTLGFSLNDGVYAISINEKIHFKASHQAGRRITTFVDTIQTRQRMDIHGCSYTYGFGENDELTYPFLLQQELPQTTVRNYAVPGYGTIQTLLILEQQIKNGDIPNRLLLNYAHFHAQRNTLSAAFRQSLYLGFQNAHPQVQPLFASSHLPYMDKDRTIHFQNWDNLYRHWRGRSYSALINALQTTVEKITENPRLQEAISLDLIRQIQAHCHQHHIQFGVALIHSEIPDSFKEKLQQEEIDVIDMRLNLQDKTYSHLPHDSHPNKHAHAYYAEQVVTYLKKKLR